MTTPIPVMHRHETLGHASTEEGARRIAKRVLRPLGFERVTATRVEVTALEPTDTYEGPAWAVGLQMRS